MKIRKGGENNARQLLLGLGMGNYNATIAIQYMFLAPSATDPAMPSIILMTKHLQLGLRAAGATDVAVSGQLDDPTARALIKLVGPEWNHVTWYALFTAVTEAQRQRTLEDRAGELELGAVPDLPEVPGGMFTWAAAAFAAWYFLFHKKRS
jgi:hypothetical protein